MIIGDQNRSFIALGDQERYFAYMGNRIIHPALPSGLISWWTADKFPVGDANKLIDVSGNGHDITLNNFADTNESGYVYKQDFLTDWNVSTGAIIERSRNKIIVTQSTTVPVNTGLFYKSYVAGDTIELDVKITGIDTLPDNAILFFGNGNLYDPSTIRLPKDGIYHISYIGTIDYTVGFRLYRVPEGSELNITIEQIPQGLQFDGVDDYGKVTGLPLLTDYTLIVNRVLGTDQQTIVSKSKVAQVDGAFIFEAAASQVLKSSWSFAINNDVTNVFQSDNISWQTKTSYNSNHINSGSSTDTDTLWVGTLRDNDNRFSNINFKSMMLFNHTLTQDEITQVTNLLNS